MTDMLSRYKSLYNHFNESGMSSKTSKEMFGYDRPKENAIRFTAKEFNMTPDEVENAVSKLVNQELKGRR